MVIWFWNTMASLEERLAAFRDANWNRDDGFEDIVDTKEEESE